MEAYEFRAYEFLGEWTLVLKRAVTDDDGHTTRDLLYHGEAHPIDETDPQMRAILLLSQVTSDLTWDVQNSEGSHPVER